MACSGDNQFDLNQVIKKVYQNPIIWDPKHRHYSKRKLRTAAWNRISQELNIGRKSLQETWEYLEHHFSKEMEKTLKLPQADEYFPNWPYFKPLLFLKPSINVDKCGNFEKLHTSKTEKVLSSPLPEGESDRFQINGAEDSSQVYITEENDSQESEFIEVIDNSHVYIKEEDDSLQSTLAEENCNSRVDIKQEDFSLQSSLTEINCNSQVYIKKEDTFIETKTVNSKLTGKLEHELKQLQACDDDNLFFQNLLPRVRRMSSQRKAAFKIALKKLINQYGCVALNQYSSDMVISNGFVVFIEKP